VRLVEAGELVALVVTFGGRAMLFAGASLATRPVGRRLSLRPRLLRTGR